MPTLAKMKRSIGLKVKTIVDPIGKNAVNAVQAVG